jgi:hypothetical protein
MSLLSSRSSASKHAQPARSRSPPNSTRHFRGFADVDMPKTALGNIHVGSDDASDSRDRSARYPLRSDKTSLALHVSRMLTDMVKADQVVRLATAEAGFNPDDGGICRVLSRQPSEGLA